MTATGSAPSDGEEASAWAIRSARSSRLGRPVVGSWSAPRWAAAKRRELSSAIEASWANRTRACVSRGPNERSSAPEASPMTPTVFPLEASGTPITDPKLSFGISPERSS